MLFALCSPSPVLFHFICWTAVCNFACCRVVKPLCLCSLAMGNNSKLSAQQWCARGIWTIWAVLIYVLSLEWTVIAATTNRKLNSPNAKKQTVSHDWQSFEGCFDSHHWCQILSGSCDSDGFHIKALNSIIRAHSVISPMHRLWGLFFT